MQISDCAQKQGVFNMFEKKCSKCGRRIEKDFEFCPYCGFNMKREKDGRDYGILGIDDDNFNLPNTASMPFGLDRVFSSLIKQIDKQFRDLDKEFGKEPKIEKSPLSRGISISISSGTGKNPEIKVRGFGPGFGNSKVQETEEKPIKIKQPEITEEQARKMAKLPRKEAETRIRRLSDKIIYEIELPEIKSLNNVIINKLENSIEIKAFTKKQVYVKLLPVKLQILDYKLEDEKLILELKTN